jgi:2-iminoacetate synthase
MAKTFIDAQRITKHLEAGKHADAVRVREVLARARQMKGLDLDEVAVLIGIEDADIWQDIYLLAKEIKNNIYGNRIVLFAPLYISNCCANDCAYCGFRRSNEVIIRHSLTTEELKKEVLALQRAGHKRLLMVYGEHPANDIEYIAKTVETAYAISDGKGKIRRININAAPMDVDEYRILKHIGIGTYQIFQETYHRDRYAEVHPPYTKKSDFDLRLYALHRAQEAGIDDVAIGVLFGLYDWKFEVMGLCTHAQELEKQFGIGPHTVSFPRLEPATNTPFYDETPYHVSDNDFKKIVAITRLMVPYTGMILTAREKPALRRELLHLGISQIDGGSRIDIGGYQRADIRSDEQKQQFMIHDTRPLDDIVRELAQDGFMPSFCTACYRSDRTGKRFMKIAKSSAIKDLCHPNAIVSFYEFLLDYAAPETQIVGEKLIKQELAAILPENKSPILHEISNINEGKRDIFF